jgi:hypothetical protein
MFERLFEFVHCCFVTTLCPFPISKGIFRTGLNIGRGGKRHIQGGAGRLETYLLLYFHSNGRRRPDWPMYSLVGCCGLVCSVLQRASESAVSMQRGLYGNCAAVEAVELEGPSVVSSTLVVLGFDIVKPHSFLDAPCSLCFCFSAMVRCVWQD